MQNEELINQLQSLIESTQYLKKGSVLSFDNNQVQVRLSDFTTITTKNLGVTKLGDCLVVTAEDGVYAIQESRENNRDTVNIINRRVNRQSDEFVKKNPEAHYVLCQIEKSNLTPETPSKFIRIDKEFEELYNRNIEPQEPGWILPGPFKRRYCIETVDPITVDSCDSDVIFDTLEECLINDLTEDENNGTSDNPQSDFTPESLGTVTLTFFKNFDEQAYEDYVLAYNLEGTFPNLSPFSCRYKLFLNGVPLGGGHPFIDSLGDLVTDSISTFAPSYAKDWVKTYWSAEDLQSIYPDGYDTYGMSFHLRDWVSREALIVERYPANVWYDWPFEFAYRHGKMGAATQHYWDGFQINCQQNRVDTIVGFMQSNGWIRDTFTCPFSGSGDGDEGNPDDPPETKTIPENEASHHIPLSKEYVVKFYLCNSTKKKAIYLHEMSVDDYFCYYSIGPYNVLQKIFSNELWYKGYVQDSSGRTWWISEPLLKYFNNQYKSIIEMYLEDAQREDYFSFNKLDTNLRIDNYGGYLDLHNLRENFLGGQKELVKYYNPTIFCTNQRISRRYPHTGDVSTPYLGVNRIATENYHKLKVFYKSKREILILINEGLVKKNFREYEYFKTHLIFIKNWKIVNKVTYTNPNINEEEIQTTIDEYNLNVLLKDYYVYKKTLYLIDNDSSVYNESSVDSLVKTLCLFSQYESIDTNGLPNFYDLTTYNLFSSRDSHRSFLIFPDSIDYSKQGFNYEIYQKILNNEMSDSVFRFKADKILDNYISSNRNSFYSLYFNNNNIEIGSNIEHSLFYYYNFEGTLIGTLEPSSGYIGYYYLVLSFMGTYDVLDSFYNGQYLTRLWKSYKVDNTNNYDNKFITEKAFFDYYETDSLTPLIENLPEFKSTVDIDEMLVPLLFQNKKEIELTFRKSKPFYNTVRKDVPLIPVEYEGSTPNLRQRYNIAKTKPPIFLNEDSQSRDIKVVISLPTNISKTTQLQKKSCRILSMQLIP